MLTELIAAGDDLAGYAAEYACLPDDGTAAREAYYVAEGADGSDALHRWWDATRHLRNPALSDLPALVESLCLLLEEIRIEVPIAWWASSEGAAPKVAATRRLLALLTGTPPPKTEDYDAD